MDDAARAAQTIRPMAMRLPGCGRAPRPPHAQRAQTLSSINHAADLRQNNLQFVPDLLGSLLVTATPHLDVNTTVSGY